MTLQFDQLSQTTETKSPLVNAVIHACKIWASASEIWWFRKELNDARRAVWDAYPCYFLPLSFFLYKKKEEGEKFYDFGILLQNFGGLERNWMAYPSYFLPLFIFFVFA